MAKVKQTVKKTKTRVKKGSGGSGWHTCPSCHGTGLKRNVGRGAR